ncbi:hypothetical protein AB0J83_41430 [Actinoplanes sp. NPDC049596]|uniref:hypothetical protein n=1 Tax=unclassified Actinoplanes TaxID=2626549 RepID=UPI0034349784
MTTTSSGLYYPASSDPVTPHEHIRDLAESIEPFIAIPYLSVYRNSEQVGFNPDGAFRAVGWNATRFKTHSSFHNPASFSGRIIPPVPGIYEFKAVVVFKSDSNSEVGVYTGVVTKNGVEQPSIQNMAISTGETNSASLTIFNELGADGVSDYFEFKVAVDTANARTVAGTEAGYYASTAFCKYIRPLP